MTFWGNLECPWTSSISPEWCPWFSRWFYSKFSSFGTICAAARFMPKTSVKIAWHKPNDMPTSSATSLIVIRRLFKIISFTASMFSLVYDIFSAFLQPVIPQLNLFSAHSRPAKRHHGSNLRSEISNNTKYEQNTSSVLASQQISITFHFSFVVIPGWRFLGSVNYGHNVD